MPVSKEMVTSATAMYSSKLGTYPDSAHSDSTKHAVNHRTHCHLSKKVIRLSSTTTELGYASMEAKRLAAHLERGE